MIGNHRRAALCSRSGARSLLANLAGPVAAMPRPNVAIIGGNYRYAALDVPFEQQGYFSVGVRIGRNVWIGANCTILDGSVIGDNTIVVPNSLVNRRFPPNVILQGNPAKIVARRGPGGGESGGQGAGAPAGAHDRQ